jgi:cell division protein FtsB
LLLVLLLAKASWSAYQKYRVSDSAYQDVTREQVELSARKDQLESDIARLKTPEGVERDIRSKFGMVKAGEKMLVLVDRGTTSSQTAPVKASVFDALKSLFKR